MSLSQCIKSTHVIASQHERSPFLVHVTFSLLHFSCVIIVGGAFPSQSITEQSREETDKITQVDNNLQLKRNNAICIKLTFKVLVINKCTYTNYMKQQVALIEINL